MNVKQVRQPLRRRLIVAAGVAMATLISPPAAAQGGYPDKPIKLVVPFPPGGSTDALARILAQEMSPALGQPIVIENRGGASGDIGALHVARSEPDGYTILIVSGAFVVNPSLGSPYNIQRDFAPITYIATVPSAIVANPSVKAKNVSELVKLIKSSPAQTFNFATPGNGSVQHLAGELLKREASVDITHVPYAGAGPAISALLGGHVQLAIASVPSLKKHIEAGKAIPIATTMKSRTPTLPDVPTFVESGFPEIVVDQIQGLLAPAGTPSAIVNKLNETVVAVLRKPEIRKKLEDQGFVLIGNSPDAFAEDLKSQGEKWAAVIKASKIRKE